ncbi:MAG: MBL fold metallo-hydrolase [Armatimonadota bacterium]
MVILKALAVGALDTNCYIVGDESTGEVLILDPGGDTEEIASALEGYEVRGIVNTHGHADHIASNGCLAERFGCPIMIHALDAPALTDPERNLAALAGFGGDLSPTADRLLSEGDEVRVGDLAFTVIHTPGHTPGGICLLSDKTLFSGDTLFASGIGRTDFPGGSYEALISSIREKLLPLDDDVKVYPGHGPATTIGAERAGNPWL